MKYKLLIVLSNFCYLIFTSTSFSQSWKAFNILSGNPNATGNEIRNLNGTTGCLGSTIATTNGIPAGNNNLAYGAAFDPTEGKLYYSKAGTTVGTCVFNVYNNTGAVATNTNLATITGGEFFRMGVGQDGNVYSTNVALVIQLSASAPRIDIQTVKLTRYNPSTNTFTVLGNIQCPSAYASTMPAPYNTGDYWSSSDATSTPFYAAQLGAAPYGDLVVSPDNTMYMTIGKKLIRIPNYASITGTAQIPSVEIGNILPTGVGFNFTTQGPGTYGLSWDYTNSNLLAISSRTNDGSDGSYNVNPSSGAISGSFRLNCLATPTSANFGDLTEVLSSIGLAKQLTTVQWLGYNNRYRLTYRIRIENIGTSVLKAAQLTENLSTAFPSLTISNVSASFVNNPAGLVLNSGYTGTGTNTLLDGTKTLYPSLYNGSNLNGGGGNITAGSNFATIDVTFDVAGVATNGITTYNSTTTATGTAFDATTVTDNSDNGTAVETGTVNYKADDAGEGDATPIKFGSAISGTVWNDVNRSANNTFSNIFTTGETGTNAGGLNAILIDPNTNLVIASVAVAANGTYSFANVPSFANLQILLSTTAGTAGSAPPAASLPSGWSFTSPNSTNTTGDVNTGTYNSADASRFGAIDDSNVDFGIILTTTWNGTTWSNGTPTSTTDAIIASNTVPTATFSCNTLTINSGISLATTGITANVNRNIINNGNGISGTGTLNIAANSSISGNNLAVTGVLTVATGATLTTNGLLTLKSTSIANAARTATIGNSAGIITGNVTVERIMSNKRAFRLLAPGVTTTTSIRANWQENQNNDNTSSNSNTNAGFGTHITGSTTGANGFDATETGGASLFTFNNSSANTWTAAANTNVATLNSLSAYRLLVRGSRAINLNSNTPIADSAVLRATGSVNNAASIVFNSSSTPTALNTSTTVNQNFSLIPNPYWAAINWATITKNNIGGSYFIWDPNMSTRGAYTSWNGTVGSGGAINQFIQPGQAFFVTTTGASPSLTIAQTDKANNLTNTFRTNQDFAKLTITLSYTNTTGNTIIADGATAIFGNYSKAIDNNEEALKLTNLDEMLSINRNGTALSIEARPLPVFGNDTIPLQLSQFTQSNYTLALEASNFNYAGKAAFVVDNFLNKTYTVNLDSKTTVPVELTNDAASKAANRFMVVFGKSILPATNNNFNIGLSPNPAKGKTVLSYTQATAENTTITITDATGKKVQTINLGKVQNGLQPLNIAKLAAGIYYVQVNNSIESKTEKLVVQ
jgi:hypothetical protein